MVMKNLLLIRNFLPWVLIVPMVLLVSSLVFIELSRYRPKNKTPLMATRQPLPVLQKGGLFSITTFNIGYCGLDRSQDFFLDGGTRSGSGSKPQTLANLQAITGYLQTLDSDFLFIQEIDKKAKRSFYLDELSYMDAHFPNYGISFAVNYKVPYVPVPFTHPMGSVHSGLALLSRYHAKSWTRYQYPGREDWPRQLFELERCFLEAKIPLDNGKILVLINSHLSAFDKGGRIRKLQLQFLKKHIVNEYQNGNYVIVGGDWNHNLPATHPENFPHQEAAPFWLQNLPADFTPKGFQWACDSGIPSVRTVAKPYHQGVNYTAVIDGFLVSPNVDIVKVQGHQLHFASSDHNPVTAEFLLK